MKVKVFLFLLLILVCAATNAESDSQSQKSKLKQKLTESIRREFTVCKSSNTLLKKSIDLSSRRIANKTNQINAMDKGLKGCKETLNVSKTLLEEKEKEIGSLRRSLASQIFITWAVSAASGVVILLIL